MPKINASIPTELLEVYRVLIQNASSNEATHGHLINFLLDAKAALDAIQNILDIASQRQA